MRSIVARGREGGSRRSSRDREKGREKVTNPRLEENLSRISRREWNTIMENALSEKEWGKDFESTKGDKF